MLTASPTTGTIAAGRRDHDARAHTRARAHPERQLGAALPQLRSGAQGALRVVLMRDGRAEHRRDGVAAQLGHDAAVVVAHGLERPVEARQRRAQRLGIEPGQRVRRGQLHEQARHPAPRLGGHGLAHGGGRRGRGDVVAQDRRLERAQVGRRLDAQALDQRAVRAAVLGQRVRLPAAAVEGEHALGAQALAQRVLAHERLQLAGDLGVAAAREVGVQALADAGQAEVLEPGDLGLREALVGDVGQRRAAPQRERAAQRRRRRARVAAGQLVAALPEQLLEAVRVERGAPQA